MNAFQASPRTMNSGTWRASSNRALFRLEKAFLELQRFSSTVPQQLCAPLTVIRSIGEAGLQKHRDRGEYRKIIQTMLEESNRLAGLVGNMLETSRAASRDLSIARGSRTCQRGGDGER
jgi:signal transduction histidine kinase